MPGQTNTRLDSETQRTELLTNNGSGRWRCNKASMAGFRDDISFCNLILSLDLACCTLILSSNLARTYIFVMYTTARLCISIFRLTISIKTLADLPCSLETYLTTSTNIALVSNSGTLDNSLILNGSEMAMGSCSAVWSPMQEENSNNRHRS